MHPVALFIDSASSDQIAAQRVVFRQICREVHLLPLELFAELFFAREAKLAQVPSLDEVKFAIRGVLVNFVWVHFSFYADVFWVHGNISLPVPKQKGIFFASEPSLIARERNHAILVKFGGYR